MGTLTLPSLLLGLCALLTSCEPPTPSGGSAAMKEVEADPIEQYHQGSRYPLPRMERAPPPRYPWDK